MTPDALACLHALRQKVLWLSTWMIHHANHVRPNRDGLKVGGHPRYRSCGGRGAGRGDGGRGTGTEKRA